MAKVDEGYDAIPSSPRWFSSSAVSVHQGRRKIVAYAAANRVILLSYSSTRPRLLGQFTNHKTSDKVSSVSFLTASIDLVVSGGTDGVMYLWDLTSKALLQKHTMHGKKGITAVSVGTTSATNHSAEHVDTVVPTFGEHRHDAPHKTCDVIYSADKSGMLCRWVPGSDLTEKISVASQEIICVAVRSANDGDTHELVIVGHKGIYVLQDYGQSFEFHFT